jgi:hypothetical protein
MCDKIRQLKKKGEKSNPVIKRGNLCNTKLWRCWWPYPSLLKGKLEQAITDMKTGKAEGIDEIPIEIKCRKTYKTGWYPCKRNWMLQTTVITEQLAWSYMHQRFFRRFELEVGGEGEGSQLSGERPIRIPEIDRDNRSNCNFPELRWTSSGVRKQP